MPEPPNMTEGTENEREYRRLHREKSNETAEKEEILNSLLFRVYYRELETQALLNVIASYLDSP